MNKPFRCLLALLSSALAVLTIVSYTAAATPPVVSVASPEEHNKALVVQYFQQILDGKQYTQMPHILAPDVVMHRPDGTWSDRDIIEIMFETALGPHTLKTTIHEMVASGDYVTVRLSHRMTFSAVQAPWRSRLGVYEVNGKSMEWEAMAMFRFKDGRIAEEWVSNDELGQLLQLGTLKFTVTK